MINEKNLKVAVLLGKIEDELGVSMTLDSVNEKDDEVEMIITVRNGIKVKNEKWMKEK